MFADGRIAIVSLRQQDLDDTGATVDEAEGIVETVRSIGSVEIAVILKELKDNQILSINSFTFRSYISDVINPASRSFLSFSIESKDVS